MSVPVRGHLCGNCGYDLGNEGGAICPECGRSPGEWTVRSFRLDRRFRLWWRLHLGATCLALAWMIALNIAYVSARLTLGRWPGPWNHPGATLPLQMLVAAMGWVAEVSLLAPVVAWIPLARRAGALGPSVGAVRRVLLAAVGTCIAVWIVTFGLGGVDPLGALEWAID